MREVSETQETEIKRESKFPHEMCNKKPLKEDLKMNFRLIN